jgi:hypothetical protein
MPNPQRIIRLAHSSPGRMRLRLRWLREAPEEATRLADKLAALNGMIEAAVRPWTGSVLCHYDPERLDEHRIVTAALRHSRATAVVRPGEENQLESESAPATSGSSLGHAVADSFAAINREVVAATDGRLDLGILASLGFVTVGAAEIAVTRQLPAPPWFNLAWWAFRTFTMFERDGPQPAGPSTSSHARVRTPPKTPGAVRAKGKVR